MGINYCDLDEFSITNLEVAFIDKNGKNHDYVFEPKLNDEGWGRIIIGDALVDAIVLNGGIKDFSGVEDLCKYISEAIFDPEQDDKVLSSNKGEFIKEMSTAIPSIEDIAKIVIERKYCARGIIDQFTDYDDKLENLAQKVLRAKGDKRVAAKEKFLEYAKTPNEERGYCTSVGTNFEDFRFSWSGSEEEFDFMIRKICGEECADEDEVEEGKEHYEFNMETGEGFKYAEYVLK